MFNQYLSDKRLPVPTPESVVDANGKVAFGTFDKEFNRCGRPGYDVRLCLQRD